MTLKIIRPLCLYSNDIKLGSLVPNIREPDINMLSLVDTDQYNLETVEETLLCPTPSNIKPEADPCTKTCVVRKSTLKNAKGLFEKLCEEKRVQDWLQKEIEQDNDVHFVVGLRTLVDPTASLVGVANEA